MKKNVLELLEKIKGEVPTMSHIIRAHFSHSITRENFSN